MPTLIYLHISSKYTRNSCTLHIPHFISLPLLPPLHSTIYVLYVSVCVPLPHVYFSPCVVMTSTLLGGGEGVARARAGIRLTLLRSNIYWWLVFFWRTAKGPTSASTVSMTPTMHALPVSLTLAKTCSAGVIDTGTCMLRQCQWHQWRIFCRYLLLGINDTGDAWHHQCQWHRWHASPVSLTLANTCFAGVIDTGKCMLRQCQ
jgi:hypothetical protein